MDREKVIKGLEHCKKYGSLGGNDCNGHYEYTDNLQEIIKANNHRKDCPYGQCRTGCVVTLVGDAIALLKEQEAVEPLTIDDAVSEIMDKHYKRLKEQDADKPKGHWMPYEPDKRGYTDGFICSRCERVILSDHYCKMIDFDFCPYCGAYMDNAEGR